MTFTVKDLKAILAKIPDDTPVVMQKDDEGNGYRLMSGIEFFPAGHEKSNFFYEEEGECYRQEDLEDLDREPTDTDIQLCAVAY